MKTRLLVVVALLALSESIAGGNDKENLAGVVRDAEGLPAVGVTILVADNATGIPLFSDGTSVAHANADQRTDLLVGMSSEDGSFEITVPEGVFRLVAQRWRAPTQPWTSGMGTFDGLPVFGEVVELFGFQNGIAVPMDSELTIELKPLGSGTATVDTSPTSGNSDTLLVIGTRAPLLDPIFAFHGWREPFLTSAIGMNRMPYGRTTFLNVPEGELHLVAFANDNRPGFGASSVNVGEGNTVNVQVDLVAGWSDGRHTPPDRLMPLYRKAVEQGWDLRSLDPIQRITARIGAGSSLYQALLDEEEMGANVALQDGSSVPIRDAWAVGMYIDQWKPNPE